jgi:uncharacterized protein YoxC
MTPTEITLLVGIQAAVLLALFVFFYARLLNQIERRVDNLARDVSDLKGRAEELRTECAKIAAQVSAIADAINASRP